MIKVLIVDDSSVVREFMAHMLSSDPGIEVVGMAISGEEAVRLVSEKKPDVVTMDIHMPGMDGYQATRTIMETFPTPVVIVSGSLGVNDVSNSFKLFEAGALAVVLRPPGMEDAGYSVARKVLVQTVKLMSEIKVVKRFPKQGKVNVSRIHLPPSENLKVTDIQLVAIGASTGGPMVLQTILSNLPNDFPAPILIVQHIARGFVAGFRDWLATSSSLPVSVAVNGEKIKPGKVYIAPDEHQMGITKGPKINLCKLPAENGLCPSVSFLFRSVSEVMGSKAIGILLTGMGKDGASELKMMKNNGAITIAQDEASSVVYGMPGEAVKIGAATKVLPPAMIAAALSDLCNNQPL